MREDLRQQAVLATRNVIKWGKLPPDKFYVAFCFITRCANHPSTSDLVASTPWTRCLRDWRNGPWSTDEWAEALTGCLESRFYISLESGGGATKFWKYLAPYVNEQVEHLTNVRLSNDDSELRFGPSSRCQTED